MHTFTNPPLVVAVRLYRCMLGEVPPRERRGTSHPLLNARRTPTPGPPARAAPLPRTPTPDGAGAPLPPYAHAGPAGARRAPPAARPRRARRRGPRPSRGTPTPGPRRRGPRPLVQTRDRAAVRRDAV